ncbi:1-deoxy-D-xylulose-5-phosphate synthase [Helicobacter sp. 11S02629-2]|uniref:1-deoxy-D-xylulose-5-phosphate synthase n=1 Tax=Helicobacter sp. 11S02629-2 TaxID=1476195 RepID=UPI000BA70142|nr:1-deoxy-D-xylulose-5-phosphate synthase [Helicobacter sp. 11S02629-2]PAF44663.1 1-deoxy-D-xylulose-5-phosphate synthase [Helicobacter sp. 11S02629-2]
MLKNVDISDKLKDADITSLESLSEAIRHRILEVVSKNGGHLSSTLGAVDLIVGMHAVFDCAKSPFIYDVSHQTYAHKLITGRYKEFETLRTFGGISGFTSPFESPKDYFIAGHSSTSISLGVGVAKARALEDNPNKPVVLVGDGAMSAGLIYEAINELGDRKYPMIIILNDNEMSIAKPIGAISRILSTSIASPFYQSFREKVKKILTKVPQSAAYLANRFEDGFKLITPGVLFEELGLNYIGPIDGHNIKEIISTLKVASTLNKPVIIHAQTIKGKGYKIAEGRYEKWHGVGPFDLSTGKSLSVKKTLSPTDVFGATLMELARKDEKIVGVSAAMPNGTGIANLIEEFPSRFFDVAIAEQHAVTSMASFAKEGFKPYVAIYSTFLQRAYDQIVHDVCIMSLPVRFCIDRAGIVGEDGETHQGLLDVSYLRSLPNMILVAPRSLESLKEVLAFSTTVNNAPFAFRYPRGSFILDKDLYVKGYKEALESKKMQVLVESKDSKVLLLGYGNGVGRALKTQKELKTKEVEVDVSDLVYLKPLDKEGLLKAFERYEYIVVLSDSYKLGGVGSAVSELQGSFLLEGRAIKAKIVSLEVDDIFVKHGATSLVEKSLGLDSMSLAEKILNLINIKGV